MTFGRLLDLVEDVADPPEPRPWDPRLRPWFNAGGLDTPWHQAPPWVREEFRASAVSLIANYPSYLPADLDVGGFTMGQATRVLEELLARGCYMNACTLRGSTSGVVIVPLVEAGALVADLTDATGVPEDRVGQIVALLTGVDISEAQLKLARAAVPRARFLHADMNEVEFDPGSFHAVVALYSLIHLPQSVLPGVLDRVRSWLVPDGHLLVTLGTVPGEGLQDDWLGVPMFFGGMAPEDNRSALETAGFEIVGEQLETAVEQGEGEVTFHWLLAKSAASRPTAPDPSR